VSEAHSNDPRTRWVAIAGSYAMITFIIGMIIGFNFGVIIFAALRISNNS
jgi:hypothetical protein